MYTPAMQGLFHAMMGQGMPSALMGTPDTPDPPLPPWMQPNTNPLFPHPYSYGSIDPNLGGPIAAPANPYGGIDTSGPSVASIAAPMAYQANATPVVAPDAPSGHQGLVQLLMALGGGQMHAGQPPQDFLKAPGLGITPDAHPWGQWTRSY